MDKTTIAIIALFVGILIAVGAQAIRQEIKAGDDVHSEIFRLREDVFRLRNILLVAAGLLAAILTILVLR